MYMLPYAVQQFFWMLKSSIRLMLILSTGVVWFFQMIRLYIYGSCMTVYFIPHMWWYLTSDHIIRRVSYRSSAVTKRRNVLQVLEEADLTGGGEALALGDAARKRSSPSPARNGNSIPQVRLMARQKRTVNHSTGRTARPAALVDSDTPESATSSTRSSAERKPQRKPNGRRRSTPLLKREGSPPVMLVPPPPSMDDAEEEDRMNLHNRATVDIVLPVPLDSLMKAMDVAKSNVTLRRKKFPVIIIISGGAWIIGSHLWASMIARVFAARGYVVFCPDYRNFPQTTMEGMVLDVSDAIAWVLQNAERYNGDVNNVTLLGHSAGAHLTMLSLLSQAHIAAYQESVQLGEELPPPSNVAYNVPRYNPRQSIHHYVGLNGTYNLEKLTSSFDQKGLSQDVLSTIAGGKTNVPRYCVNTYFDSKRMGEIGEALPDNVFDSFPSRMSFLHGGADNIAPPSESSSLVNILRLAQQSCSYRRMMRIEEHNRHSVATLQDNNLAAFPIQHMPSPSEAVNFQYVYIPQARHADVIIEECLVANRSCCADYLCDYETVQSSNPDLGKRPARGVTTSEVVPDTVLQMAVPPSDRPLLLRFITLICPF